MLYKNILSTLWGQQRLILHIVKSPLYHPFKVHQRWKSSFKTNQSQHHC